MISVLGVERDQVIPVQAQLLVEQLLQRQVPQVQPLRQARQLLQLQLPTIPGESDTNKTIKLALQHQGAQNGIAFFFNIYKKKEKKESHQNTKEQRMY